MNRVQANHGWRRKSPIPRTIFMSALVLYLTSFSNSREPREESGQSLVEYAMILLLIAIACMISVTAFSTVVQDRLFSVIETLANGALGGGG